MAMASTHALWKPHSEMASAWLTPRKSVVTCSAPAQEMAMSSLLVDFQDGEGRGTGPSLVFSLQGGRAGLRRPPLRRLGIVHPGSAVGTPRA